MWKNVILIVAAVLHSTMIFFQYNQKQNKIKSYVSSTFIFFIYPLF